MTTTFQASGVLGRCAVWTGNTEAPWSNPTGNLGNIKIHSDLDNAGIVSIRNGTLAPHNFASLKTNLFAHGLGYAPLILGFVTISGDRVPINQSVLMPSPGGGVISLSFGADQTNVFVNRLKLKTGVGLGSGTIPYEIYVFDVGITSGGAFRRPTKFAGLEFSTAGVTRIGYISSLNRYLHKISSGRLALPRGKTIDAKIGRGPGSTMGVGVRQSVNGYLCQRLTTAQSGQPGNSASFNAAITATDI